MSQEFLLPTQIEKQRHAYFSKRAKPGMTMGEYFQLNQEILRLFPVTREERQAKFEQWKAIPEFVL